MSRKTYQFSESQSSTAKEFITSSDTDNDFASRYDYCMVLPLEENRLSDVSQGYLDIISVLGIQFFAYRGSAAESLYVLLKVPLARLREYADEIDHLFLLGG